ncbi:MAG: hypothetical protein AABY27_04640 [Pseudomonadota bacterium]
MINLNNDNCKEQELLLKAQNTRITNCNSLKKKSKTLEKELFDLKVKQQSLDLYRMKADIDCGKGFEWDFKECRSPLKSHPLPKDVEHGFCCQIDPCRVGYMLTTPEDCNTEVFGSQANWHGPNICCGLH